MKLGKFGFPNDSAAKLASSGEVESFLGKRFGQDKDFPAHGVNKDLGRRLVRAQTVLYAPAFQDKADEAATTHNQGDP